MRKLYRIVLMNRNGEAVMKDTNLRNDVSRAIDTFKSRDDTTDIQVFQYQDGLYKRFIKETKSVVGFH